MAMFDRKAARQHSWADSAAFLTLVLIMTAALTEGAAADALVQPPICSAIGASDTTELQLPFCRVTPKADDRDHHDVTLSLTATTSPVHVGGYRIDATENYNSGYLPPVVELMAGDTLKVRLLDALAVDGHTATAHDPTDHGMGHTNIHTHGLIVSPKNATDKLPQNGDNIFIDLHRGQSFDYSIDIPDALPASILDRKSGIIEHPRGLYWYHSHLHMQSAKEVGGGMSGLLSIGAPDANLLALDPDTHKADPTATAALKAATNVSYLMLRDIQIKSETTDPAMANGRSPAEWVKSPDTHLCDPVSGVAVPAEGYCQNATDKHKIWLFTVNGQRFPTIRIPAGQNNLLRIANLSASASYTIELIDASGKPVQFDLISVDGVVPGMPITLAGPAAAATMPESLKKAELPLLPAARAEILLKNDPDTKDRRLVLRTRGRQTPWDHWPTVLLAEVILEGAPVVAVKAVTIGLNVPNETFIPQDLFTNEGLNLNLQNQSKTVQQFVRSSRELKALQQAPGRHPGCVQDIDRTKFEHRRIWFQGYVSATDSRWVVTTEIVHPKSGSKGPPYNYSDFEAHQAATIDSKRFDDYLKKPDGSVDWDMAYGAPPHTCVRLGNGHGQLWELQNPSGELHNFHLHQTKFRLATDKDLAAYGIAPLTAAEKKAQRSELLLEPLEPIGDDQFVWHDTLPMDPKSKVPLFIIINFDAKEQLGKYVYHCHILSHEDIGLMAPMEVIP
jgi:FtsP/CotA-like multicopper oxidase with cupredoxin domain